MYSHIMVPVDLAHKDKLARSLQCAADLAKTWGAKVTYVGVTSSAPGQLGHNPGEYAENLAAFAAAQADSKGIESDSHVAVSHDPTIDLDATLIKAQGDLNADLIVMESHVPNIVDYVWASHGGTLASHAKASVMLVRG